MWYDDGGGYAGAGYGVLWDGLGNLILPTGATEVDRLVETFCACWRPGKYAAAGCLVLSNAGLLVGLIQDSYHNLQIKCWDGSRLSKTVSLTLNSLFSIESAPFVG